MNRKKIPPVHPGEILFEEFLKPMEISQNQLGRDLRVSPRRINAYFGNSPSFWLGLQMDYDLDVVEDTLSAKIKKEVRHHATG
jgi:plasmid maintenance system antidote protein VapI